MTDNTSHVGVELPFPDRALSPNARCGWRQKAVAVKEYRWACHIMTKAVWGQRAPLQPPVVLSVTFVVKNNRRRDLDNLIASFKAGLDGMVDGGLLESDHWQGLTVSYTIERGATACVRVQELR